MDSYKETFETWDKVAKLYQDKFMDMDLYNDSYDSICKLIAKRNAALLEIGCGPGNITKYLSIKRPDFKIEAIDVSPNMIKLAKHNVPTASFKVMDCRNIHQLKTKFDAIVCGFCVPYLSTADCSNLISDCYELLHEDGLIYLSFVEGESTKSGYMTASSGDRTFFYFHSMADIQKMLMSSSFRIMEQQNKAYKKADGVYESHIIVVAIKQSKTANNNNGK